MEKYKVEVNSTEAHEGRGSRRSGGWSRWSKSINLANGVKTAGRDSFRGSGKMICSERKALQESQREKKGGDEAAAKDEGHDRYDKENQAKGQNGRT